MTVVDVIVAVDAAVVVGCCCCRRRGAATSAAIAVTIAIVDVLCILARHLAPTFH